MYEILPGFAQQFPVRMRIIDWRGNPRYLKEYFLRKKPRRAPRP
jgi:hypothetical protein